MNSDINVYKLKRDMLFAIKVALGEKKITDIARKLLISQKEQLERSIRNEEKQKAQSYKIRIEVNKDELLKDIRNIKKEVKEIVNECEYEINKLKLKRKDILVVKVHALYKANDMKAIKKKLEKQLHRRVLLINDSMDISHVISYKKK